MHDAYVTAFYDVVKEAQELHGYNIPEHLEQYVVMLLAFHVRRVDFMPEKTFAEAYLALKAPFKQNAKELGDTCLFVNGVFPTLGYKKGLDKKYYSNIGKSSYSMASDYLNGYLFTELSIHFDFLSDFIETVTHSPTSVQSNLFR